MSKMSFHQIFAHVILAIAIALMGGAIVQTQKLLAIVKGSKAEAIWKRSRIIIIVITIFYIFIMISNLLSSTLEVDWFFSGSYHEIIMNATFLLVSILILTMVNLDIKAFNSLFQLLDDSSSPYE